MAKESSSGESFLRAVRPGAFLAGAHKIPHAGGSRPRAAAAWGFGKQKERM